jgi:SanA protein
MAEPLKKERQRKQKADALKPAHNRKPFKRRLILFLLIFVILTILTAGFILLIDLRVEKAGREKVAEYDDLAGLAVKGKFDCVIVPGALVHPDGQPSEMLSDRLDMAIRIFRDGLTDRILVSGDHGSTDYNEVGSMREYLLDAGIPAECIFMDHAGFDTYDTVYRAKSIFCIKRALITTQDFHLYRALYIGKQLDIDLWGVACEYSDSYKKPWYRFREFPARVKAFLNCEILHSSSTYGGPQIPISGDGRATLDE